MRDKWANFVHTKFERSNPFLTNVRQEINSVKPDPVTHPTTNPTEPIVAIDRDTIRQHITPLHISTQTISLFLNKPIDIHALFDKIPIISYAHLGPGILKKQIIMEALTLPDAQKLHQQLMGLQIMSPHPVCIKSPSVLHTFSHKVSKYKFHVSIGFSRKNFKKPSLNAFSHCVALTIRIFHAQKYHDTHVKIFNTGKVEIPGKFTPDFIQVLQENITQILWKYLRVVITHYTNEPVAFINSNFGIPITLNLENFYQVLNQTYKLNATLDICKFHGITCSFYYNTTLPEDKQTGCIEEADAHLSTKKLKMMENKYLQAHFICYQTGKCLIAGKISEHILRIVYAFFCDLIVREYEHFYEGLRTDTEIEKTTNVRRAVRMRATNDYLDYLANSGSSRPILSF